MNNQNYNYGQPMQQGYPQGYGQPTPQGYPQQGMQQGYPQHGYPQGYQMRSPYPTGNKKVGIIAGILVAAVLFIATGLVGYMLKDMAAKSGRSSSTTINIFAGKNWLEATSNSYIVTESGNKFKYYKDKGVYDDYYYEGHYRFYMGEDAYRYVTEDLSSYGVTKNELDKVFARNDDYDKSNFVCLVLENEKCIVDGVDTYAGRSAVVTPYYGFYVKDGNDTVLDIANMNKAEYYYFIPEDK